MRAMCVCVMCVCVCVLYVRCATYVMYARYACSACMYVCLAPPVADAKMAIIEDFVLVNVCGADVSHVLTVYLQELPIY